MRAISVVRLQSKLVRHRIAFTSVYSISHISLDYEVVRISVKVPFLNTKVQNKYLNIIHTASAQLPWSHGTGGLLLDLVAGACLVLRGDEMSCSVERASSTASYLLPTQFRSGLYACCDTLDLGDK